MSTSRLDGRIARGDATRSRLVEAAWEVIAQDGLVGLTTREVARRAGVSHGQCHYHFAGKGELLLAVVELVRRDWILPMERLCAADAPPLDRLEATIAWMAEPATQEVMRVHLDLTARAEVDDGLRRRVAAEYRRWMDAYVRLFRDLAAAGELADGLDVDGVAQGFATAADGLVTMRSLDPALDTEAIMRALVAPLLRR